MVSTNNRKMDKSTVLKSTISFLKNHNGKNKVINDLSVFLFSHFISRLPKDLN